MKQTLALLISLLSLCIGAFCQTGYLGHTRSLEIRQDLFPAVREVTVLKNDVVKMRPRVFYARTEINISQVLTRKIEISAGYQYYRFRTQLGDFTDYDTAFYYNGTDIIANQYTILNDPVINMHGFNFKMKFYRKGNISPIGKYIGLQISYGRGILKKSTPIIYGNYVDQLKNGFVRTYEVVDLSTTLVKKDVELGAGSLHLLYGQNFPITRRFAFNLQISIPLIYFGYDTTWNFYDLSVPDAKYDEVNQVLSKHLSSVALLYNRITLDFGMRFHF